MAEASSEVPPEKEERRAAIGAYTMVDLRRLMFISLASHAFDSRKG